MHRNCLQCAHCGKTLPRLTLETPIINRSDGERFHVSLFAGPNPRLKFSGGHYDDQVICDFAYAHDKLGPREYTLLVVIPHNEEEPERVRQQTEEAADRLAELLEQGQTLTDAYTFESGRLTLGFPH